MATLIRQLTLVSEPQQVPTNDIHKVSAALPKEATRDLLALARPVLYAAQQRPTLRFLLPVLSSADNLLIGARDEPMQFWADAGAAIVSRVVAFVGFSLCSLLERPIQGAVQ